MKIDLPDLFFRTSGEEWNSAIPILSFPVEAYLSQEAAEAELEEGEVIVTWIEMTRRIARGIKE